jgi:hypothetical protein
MQTFGQHLKNLLRVQPQLPPNLQAFIDEITGTVLDVLQSVNPVTNEAVASGATPTNKEFVLQANVAYLDAAFEAAKIQFPAEAQKLEEIMAYVSQLDIKIQLSMQPKVKQATTAAIKGIQLNTRGEFAQVTKDIEQTAMGFVERFGVKPIWARNLVGMFTSEIDLKDRAKFLKLCYNGDALNIKDMIRKGHGSLEDVVATSEPTIQKIFKSIKETLLDISLSTGQRGATGPFEAMLAIMGGARKPNADEGGDLKINVGGKDKKFEVKAGSITINDGSPGESAAWLDSTAGAEVSGDYLRGVANDYVQKHFPNLKPAEQALWNSADFRSTKLKNLRDILNIFENRKKGVAVGLLSYMMADVFPSVTQIPEFNFKQSIRNILKGIIEGNPKAVAKEQGTMAMLEYAVGKGNDGFILFNSSFQEYKIIMGVKGVLDVYHDTTVDTPEELKGKGSRALQKPEWSESRVRYLEPMTMQRGKAKCSPSIFYGPLARSTRSKEYVANYLSDPDRAQRRAEVERAGDPEFEHNSGFEKLSHPISAPRARRSQGAETERQRRK